MSSIRKTINTPEILKNEYGKQSSSSQSQSSPTLAPVLDNSEPTLPEQQQEQYNKDKEKENQQSTQPQTSPTTTTSEEEKEKTSNVSSGTSDKPLYETRPSKFKMSKWGYLSPKDNPRRRDKKNIFGIVLHHTTHLQYSDKGKTAFKNWYNNNKPQKVSKTSKYSSNAHVVIDITGHIEYGVPYEYSCVTQGNKGSVDYVYKSDGKNSGAQTGKKYFKNTNVGCIGCEVENYGFFSKTRTRNGKIEYSRGTKWLSEEDYDIVPLVDYDGKKISFKTQIANIEYPQAQCNAIYDWIKEVMDWLEMDWKFNKDTYKQMFPNMGRSKFFTNGKNSPNYKKPVFIEKDGLYIIDKSGKFGNWAISKDAQEGVRGVYTHSSCISNKTDLCPTPNIIKMLKRFS